MTLAWGTSQTSETRDVLTACPPVKRNSQRKNIPLAPLVKSQRLAEHLKKNHQSTGAAPNAYNTNVLTSADPCVARCSRTCLPCHAGEKEHRHHFDCSSQPKHCRSTVCQAHSLVSKISHSGQGEMQSIAEAHTHTHTRELKLANVPHLLPWQSGQQTPLEPNVWKVPSGCAKWSCLTDDQQP